LKDADVFYRDTSKYLIENVPSLSQLLPTDVFLDPYGTLQCEENKNTWLENLNGSSSLSLLTNKDDTDPPRFEQ